jgi:hypothetical protein
VTNAELIPYSVLPISLISISIIFIIAIVKDTKIIQKVPGLNPQVRRNNADGYDFFSREFGYAVRSIL